MAPRPAQAFTSRPPFHSTPMGPTPSMTIKCDDGFGFDTDPPLMSPLSDTAHAAIPNQVAEECDFAFQFQIPESGNLGVSLSSLATTPGDATSYLPDPFGKSFDVEAVSPPPSDTLGLIRPSMMQPSDATMQLDVGPPLGPPQTEILDLEQIFSGRNHANEVPQLQLSDDEDVGENHLQPQQQDLEHDEAPENTLALQKEQDVGPAKNKSNLENQSHLVNVQVDNTAEKLQLTKIGSATQIATKLSSNLKTELKLPAAPLPTAPIGAPTKRTTTANTTIPTPTVVKKEVASLPAPIQSVPIVLPLFKSAWSGKHDSKAKKYKALKAAKNETAITVPSPRPAPTVVANASASRIDDPSVVAAASIGSAMRQRKRSSKSTRKRSGSSSSKKRSRNTTRTTPVVRTASGADGERVDAPVKDKCVRCSTSAKNTPMMRKGPDGCRSLCNACGLKWSRHGIY